MRAGIALGAALVCALPAATIQGEDQGGLAIAVRLHVDSSITSHRLAGDLKDEAAMIWRPYGVRLEWTDTDAPLAAHPLAVKARVERDRARPNPTEWSAVLGRVELNPQTEDWRTIRISFDATERALTQWRTGRSSMNGGVALDRELGRALGRVLAHEIGHVLLGPPHHDRTGLMRAVLPANELSERDRRPFRLDASGVDRLRARVRALRAAAEETDDGQLWAANR